MMQIIRKCLDYASQTPLTNDQLTHRALSWAEVLWPIIPEERLADSLHRAFEGQTSSFSLTATDLKLAWEKIAVEDEERLANEEREKLLQEGERKRRGMQRSPIIPVSEGLEIVRRYLADRNIKTDLIGTIEKSINAVDNDQPARYYDECPLCLNSGFIQTSRHDRFGRSYRGVIKCQTCDDWERRSEEIGEKEKGWRKI
jgi:hypothetical protein